MKNTHTLGLRGHFAITSLMQNAADHYHAQITSDGDGAYRVHGDDEDGLDFDVDTFAPSFIKHDGDVLSRRDTKALLDFMHQPFRVLAEQRQTQQNPDLTRKAHFKASHEDRVAMHRLLRFATTGSVEIPADVEEELEKETAECHAQTEQAMRDMDSWRKEIELGSEVNTQSTIPNSRIDPAKGFAFDLDETCHSASLHKGVHQETLNALFWRAINKATEYRHDEKPQTVYLSASELEQFYNEAHNMGLCDLIDQVEFEEAVQEKLGNVKDRIASLEYSQAFKKLSSDEGANKTSDLKDLMYSSTAFKPIIESNAMHETWARYNFTERNNSPIAGLGKEYAVFAALMDIYSSKSNVSDVEMEAIAQEFAPLMAFSDKIAETLQESFDKTGANSPAQNVLDQARENFKSASVAGIAVSSDMMKGDYQDILSALDKSMNQGGSALAQTGEAAADTALDFTMDVVNFIKESPKVAATFVGLATTLYIMNGASPDEAQAAAETIMVFGENGLEEITIDSEILPEEARNAQNWHWDMGPLGMYKHYMYDNAVVGPAQTMMDWMRIGIQGGLEATGLPVNPEPAFSKTAETTADSLGKQLFNINLFQNASHAAFWMYMASKGYNHGFKGANKIFDLMSPLTDLSYQAGTRGAELLHLKKKTSLSDRLLELTKDVRPDITPDQKYEAAFQKECMFAQAACTLKEYDYSLSLQYSHTIDRLVEAADARLDLEETLPAHVRSAELDLKLAGIKHHFEIGSDNLSPTLDALHQFDLTLEHMADHVGIGEPWYQHYVRERLEAVTQALKDYQGDGDQEALQQSLSDNLQQLIETQVRHTDTSPLYVALMGHEMGQGEHESLNKSASAQYGRLKRADKIATNRAALSDAQSPLSFTDNIKTRASIAGTALWGGVVGASREVRKGAGKVLGNKAAVIGTSALAATCVALDMANGGNAFSDAISSGTGGMLSGAVTTTTFALYNFWEDVLGVHVGSGLALLAAGAGAGYAYKRIANPLGSSGLETLKGTTGLDVASAWDKVRARVSKTTNRIGRKLDRLNQRAGHMLTSDPDNGQSFDDDQPMM